MKKLKYLSSVTGLTAALFAAPAALAAPSTPPPAAPSGGALTPAYGDIHPFYGDIHPFYGDIHPFSGDLQVAYGDIHPFYGDIHPFYGDIHPFYGDIHPFYGDIHPFAGSVKAAYGDIHPFYGDIHPFYGDIHPFYGDIHPFSGPVKAAYGDIHPFYGDIHPFYGDIHPFYGDIHPFAGLKAAYGDIHPFYGDIHPFYGDIHPFSGDLKTAYGDIHPFYGDIHPFYGDIHPFSGDLTTAYGDIHPFYGDIHPFYGDIHPFYGDIHPFSQDPAEFYRSVSVFWRDLAPMWRQVDEAWAQADSEAEFLAVAKDLVRMIARSEASWGRAVQVKTGQSFWDGFARDLLADYGVDLSDPSSLQSLSAYERDRLYLAWQDGLMLFGNFDILDRWMPIVNWGPGLTLQGDASPVVGMLDTSFAGDADLEGKLIYSGGYDYNNGHGSAVGGLIAGSIDGHGVMGLAPGASLAAYNPYDESGTAGWADVRSGLIALGGQNASVVNISMGVPGGILSPEWASIFADPAVQAGLGDSVFVKAAGNDGLSQIVDIPWNAAADIELLIVGSIDPFGRISQFSNTPGESCLLIDGVCREENKLKYRFLVAPGELVLTSDGAGGVTRNSGTSLAAPMVTGAVALLHQRWPWLSNHAEESADIILQSARDLGAPGVDPVYGWGLLDVAASQAPLDVRNLVFYEADGRGGYQVSDARLNTLVNSQAQRANWGSGDAVVHAFEQIGDTHRDFDIPLSALTVSQSFGARGPSARFQSYLDNRMAGFTNGAGFSDVSRVSAPVAGDEAWSLTMTVSDRAPDEAQRDGTLPFQTGMIMASPDQGFEFRFGHGEGAMALSDRAGFGVFSDFDGENGGVNPVLGLASGGLYAGGSARVNDRMRLKFGVTQQTNEHIFINPVSGAEESILAGLRDYEAAAMNVGADYFATDRLTLGASYTHLYEGTGLLGVQGLGPLDLSGGAATNSATFDANYALDFGIDLSASATLAQTSADSVGGAVLSFEGDVLSSAFGFALAKTGIVGEQDRLRFSIAQPLHVESGSMTYASVQVVDRATGELGFASERFDISGARDYAFEALYALPVLNGAGEVAAFGRADMADGNFGQGRSGVAFGARFGMDF